MAGQNSDAEGADFVGRVAVGGDAVRADHAQGHEAPGHKGGAGVVAGHGYRDAVALELPGGEAGALQEGPGLVSDDADVLSVFEGGAHNAEGRAVARRGQGAGVAVGEDDVVIVHAGKAEAAYGHARRDVRAAHGFGLADEELHEVFGSEGCVLFPEGGHMVHGPGEVNGRGAGSPEIGEMFSEFFPPVRAG